MTSLRRLAPLSLSLALLLTNGSAMAYNGYRVAYDAAPAHASVFKKLGQVVRAPFVAAKKAVDKKIAAGDAAYAKDLAERAAKKDFGKWLNENPSMKTFYKGARADEGIRSQKTWRALNVASGVVNITTPSPINFILGAANFGAVKLLNKVIRSSERTARERTVDMGMKTISVDRLTRWSKAGIIDPDLAK